MLFNEIKNPPTGGGSIICQKDYGLGFNRPPAPVAEPPAGALDAPLPPPFPVAFIRRSASLLAMAP